jgi:hypothetical protein
MQATGLLGWSRRQMSEAIEAGDVELWTTPHGKWFPRAEMMAKALEIWPMHVIEEALGDEADGILPQAIRSAELRVRLPHHIDMLEYRADQQQTTVSGVLSRELTASPARTSRSCRPRCRGSRRRWRGRVTKSAGVPPAAHILARRRRGPKVAGGKRGTSAATG